MNYCLLNVNETYFFIIFFYRPTELLRLQGTSEGHLVQPNLPLKQGHLQQAPKGSWVCPRIVPPQPLKAKCACAPITERRKYFQTFKGNFLCFSTPCLWFCHSALVGGAWLRVLCNMPADICIDWYDSPHPSLGLTVPALPVSLHVRDAPNPWSYYWSFPELFKSYIFLLHWTQYSKCGQWGRIASLNLMATLFPVQIKAMNFATGAQCWLTFNFVFSRTPGPLKENCFPTGKIEQLLLYSQILYVTSCQPFSPGFEIPLDGRMNLCTPFSSESLANFLRLCSTLSSRILVTILSKVGSSADA